MDSLETEIEERERLGFGRGRRERRKEGCRGRFFNAPAGGDEDEFACGTTSVVASVPPFVASIEGRSEPLARLQLESSSSSGGASFPLIPSGANGSSGMSTLVRFVLAKEEGFELEVGDLARGRRDGGEKDCEERV